MNYTARFDTKILAKDWGQSSYWMDSKRATAELEAHRERVRQVFMRSFGPAMKSSEWVQAIMYVESANNIEELKRVCNSFDIVWKEEGDMVTKNEEIAKLQADIAKLTQKVEKLQLGRMGKEPANGTVFKIEKRYQKTGAGYVFAAVRAGGFWYLTGTGVDGSRQYTWETLKKFIGDYSRVWTMTAKEELVD